MTILATLIWLAGLLQLVVAAGNFVLPHKLRYQENLAQLEPLFLQMFIVHHAYIVLVLVGSGLLCMAYPQELASGESLPRSLAGFLAAFWICRIGIQFLYYDSEVKNEYRVAHWVFSALVIYLSFVFAAATLS